MKKLFLFALGVMTLTACNKQCCKEHRHTCWAYDATIYEMNTRQLTPEGTFAAAEALLPQMKDNGIDIIWVMPCQPIGELTRKGTLGSYYSIKDYCQINPEFGTMDDFRHFLNTAHELGMKVILDWVANHTSPDSEWTKNEGWYYRDSLGNLMVQYDWTDISKLNYDNQEMRAAMKQAMHYWMDSVGIDGFRCDVAGEVPTDFWNDAMAELKAKHPKMFALAENEDKAQEFTETAFDMYYGWELHHLMNEVAQGNKTATDLWAYFEKCDTTIRPEAIRMNFTSNHDENSWNGTEYERMGDAADMFTAFTYTVPGMPMIYTGQPSGNSHRLSFFEKDTIDTLMSNGGKKAELYKTLNTLRAENSALWSPECGAPMKKIVSDNGNIFACVRQKECKRCGNNTVIAIFNMTGEEQEATLQMGELAGVYNCTCGKDITFEAEQPVNIQPWHWLIATSK
ncbi:MAG: alpha-amylase family glycosyl hydrolase [Paludibacteraceae bacterium]|nr:alpha-amylase family glycosyl hydrolase [Paludibacteraceae bacterium]